MRTRNRPPSRSARLAILVACAALCAGPAPAGPLLGLPGALGSTLSGLGDATPDSQPPARPLSRVTATTRATVSSVTQPLAQTLEGTGAAAQNLVAPVASAATLGGVAATTAQVTTVAAPLVTPVTSALPLTAKILPPSPGPKPLVISASGAPGIAAAPNLLLGPDPGQALALPAAAPLMRVADPAAALEGAEGALAAGDRRGLAGDLLRRHPDAVEADEAGDPIVRGEVLRLGAGAGAAAAAKSLGYGVRDVEDLGGLDLSATLFTAPEGVSARDAVRQLKALDPAGDYVVNPIYLPSGAVGPGGAPASPPAAARTATGQAVGLIDGGVAVDHPSLKPLHIVQRGFVDAAIQPTAHGTAVASLLAGREAGFRSAAPGAEVYAADVFGGSPKGGSAIVVAQALSWMATNRVRVVNISLAGPSNPLLAAAVRAASDRGVLLVAAVGNEGPAAPPLYPAAYPEVVAVTGVNAEKRVLPEASRGGHVDFAAPGADMLAAAMGGGFAAVRGTSFASPLVAGRLAGLLARPGETPAKAVAAVARQAIDLGSPGRDPIYGAGLVAFELRTPPETAFAAR